jgi:hypothetical protein
MTAPTRLQELKLAMPEVLENAGSNLTPRMRSLVRGPLEGVEEPGPADQLVSDLEVEQITPTRVWPTCRISL